MQDMQAESNATDSNDEKSYEQFQLAGKCGHQARRFQNFIRQCSGRFLKRAGLAFVIT